MVRKLGKQLAPLRALYAAFRGRCPYTAETLERFVEVRALLWVLAVVWGCWRAGLLATAEG